MRSVENFKENFVARAIDNKDVSSLQEKMERVLPAVEDLLIEFKKQGNNRVWQLRNAGMIDYVKEARSLLEQYGSSQIIQNKLESGEVEADIDDARLLAFCRVLEINRGQEN